MDYVAAFLPDDQPQREACDIKRILKEMVATKVCCCVYVPLPKKKKRNVGGDEDDSDSDDDESEGNLTKVVPAGMTESAELGKEDHSELEAPVDDRVPGRCGKFIAHGEVFTYMLVSMPFNQLVAAYTGVGHAAHGKGGTRRQCRFIHFGK